MSDPYRELDELLDRGPFNNWGWVGFCFLLAAWATFGAIFWLAQRQFGKSFLDGLLAWGTLGWGAYCWSRCVELDRRWKTKP